MQQEWLHVSSYVFEPASEDNMHNQCFSLFHALSQGLELLKCCPFLKSEAWTVR